MPLTRAGKVLDGRETERDPTDKLRAAAAELALGSTELCLTGLHRLVEGWDTDIATPSEAT